MPKTQHKAPSQVTVVAHEEKSEFAAWVERHWMKGAIVAALVTVGILGYQLQRSKATEAQSERWGKLRSALGSNPTGDDISAVLAELKGTDTEGWALWVQAQAFVQERKYAEARGSIQRLTDIGENVVATKTTMVGGSSSTLAEYLEKMIAAQEAWESQYPTLFANPELPEGSPRVRIRTNAGDLVVGLFQERAPKHVENFLKHCEAGFYNDTKFHQVFSGVLVRGGDPNTKEGDVSNWGQGGPGYTVEAEEEDTGLYHFEGVLSADKDVGGIESSGSRFALTASPAHGLDAQNVVFGTVIEGLELIQEVSESELEDEASGRPVDPVTITATEVL